MKRVCLFVAMFACSPIVAAAQVTPPVPPAPPAAPAPRPAAPPAPLVPPAIMVRPMIDMMIDRQAIEDAVRASQEAIRQVDVDAIRQQAEEAAQQARDQAAEARDFAVDMRDFALFDMQNRGRGALTFNMRSSDQGGAYNSGLNDLSRHQYDQAVTRFDQVIAQKGPHSDGALYWKAFAQWKLSKTDDALATLAELRKSYGQSRYLGDAKVLESDVRKSPGDANDDEMKLLAISGMQNSDPDRAVTLAEGMLKASNNVLLKKRALFVLAQNDRPAAHQILVNYAKGSGNPDLQLEAIRYLAARRGQVSSAELMEIYNSTQDLDVRRAVLDALVSAGDKPGVMKILTTSTAPIELRRQAISNLSNNNLASPQEVFQLYQKEENVDLRMTMVRALGSLGAVDQLAQVIKTEKDPAVRQQAIHSLGNMKSDKTGQSLVELYTADQDKDTRKAVISALANQNNADALVAVARKESSSELRVEIVRKLADLAKRSKAAADYLAELIK